MFPIPVILTLDLGTTATKAALWSEGAFLAVGRGRLTTSHPAPGWAEQDPASWWDSVVDACRAARAAAPDAFGRVEVVGFSTARQTFAPVDAAGTALGPALVWSDRRAVAEAAALNDLCGGPAAAVRRTGMALDAGSVPAKAAWLSTHRPGAIRAARWLLGPRELLLWRMSGEVVTDVTVASASGLYAGDGSLVAELAGEVAALLPPPARSTAVAGELLPDAARELGLRPGIPLVVGAGDRQCEVVGTGASRRRPSVSWGTTANVSAPVGEWPDPLPRGLRATRAALGGWQLEGGVSAAGSLLAWLATLTATPQEDLVRLAAARPPGARGVVALPWLGGARAPWWAEAGAAFAGLSPAHDAGDLARAAVEGVAWDVARCIDAIGGCDGLALAGGGAEVPVWADVVTAVTGLLGSRRRTAEAASAGAAVLAAAGVGMALDVDAINPVVAEVAPDAAAVASYRRLRAAADEAAAAVLALGLPGAGGDAEP